ncbi:MAG: tetratricopeptide repeat protein [Deltaproteobacteria bacterium]|nr:tetratricopeptide repeat protein [Deltaproteobacteria bacterium]
MRKTWVMKGWVVALIVTLCFALGATGCASKKEKEAKHLQRAHSFLKEKNYKAAVIEFRNVVQLNPKNDKAYYELGETYLKLGKGRKAFQAFSRAVSANPDNLQAQLKVGQIFLLAKKTDEAEKKANLVLQKEPENLDGLTLLAGVYVQKKDIEPAIETLNKVQSLDPKRFQTYLSLGRLYGLKKDFQKATEYYEKALSLKPDSRVASIELARLYGRKGNWKNAEAVLREMVERSDGDPQSLFVLARFYEERGDWSRAEETYLKAGERASKQDVSPLMNLAGFYARRGKYDKALEQMNRAQALRKDDLAITNSIARLHLQFGKVDATEALVDQVLAKDKGNVEANYLKGRLDLQKREFDKAISRLALVIRERPSFGQACYFRALAYMGKGNRQLAKRDLVKAVELDGGLVKARMLLAEFYLKEKAPDLALEQINALSRMAPRESRVWILKAGLDMLQKNPSGAEAALKKAIDLSPKNTSALVRLGLLYSLTGKSEKAIQSFKKALDINPKQAGALTFLVQAYAKASKVNEALKLCEAMRAKVSKSKPHIALIDYLEGRLALSGKQPKKAEALFKRAIETNPDMLSPYVALAGIYVREDRVGEALSQYEKLLQKNPKFIGAYMAIGVLHDQKGDWKKAEEYYRKALEIKSDFAPAANNLAWSLAAHGGNIDEALALAQTAKEKMPESPEVMDTLGWIYYLKGSYLNAVFELNDALEKTPDNAVINYHMGMALAKNNQPERARAYLEKALKLNPKFQGADEARKTLAALQAKGS